MRIFAAIFGIVVILLVAQDAFETIVLPRRVARRIRIARFFFIVTWNVWKSLGRLMRPGARRESYLSYYGPLSLLALFLFWAVLFVFAFGLLLWGLALPFNAPEKTISFLTYLYLSGTTFFTLGLGDVIPVPGVARLLVVSEVALGFGFLALVISYVPVIYQAFSRRELRISVTGRTSRFPSNCSGDTPSQSRWQECRGTATDPARLGTVVRGHPGEPPVVSSPGLLSLTTRPTILAGSPDGNPGYVRADPGWH